MKTLARQNDAAEILGRLAAVGPEVDQEVGGTRPAAFAGDVAELVRLTELFRTQACSGSTSWPPHPVFGRMSKGAWLRWGYLHMDHHLRQFGA